VARIITSKAKAGQERLTGGGSASGSSTTVFLPLSPEYRGEGRKWSPLFPEYRGEGGYYGNHTQNIPKDALDLLIVRRYTAARFPDRT
jgi:hypothetical protein